MTCQNTTVNKVSVSHYLWFGLGKEFTDVKKYLPTKSKTTFAKDYQCEEVKK